MKGVFYGFVIGAIVGATGHWYFTQERHASEIDAAKDQVTEGVGKVKDTITDQIDKLNPEKIKEGIENTGKAVTEKAKETGQAIADATADIRLTATIKAKFAKADDVSALNIKVSTTEGVVTLSGHARSAAEVAKAITIARDTEGVEKVRSTIEIGD